MTSPENLRENVQVIFHGLVISPFNLQGIKPAIDIFEKALEQSKGRNILFMEAPTATYEDAQRSKIVVEHHGLVDPLLGDIFRARRQIPNQQILDQLRSAILRVGPRAIEMGLLPITMTREYFFSQELERLRTHFSIEVEYEGHSPEVVEQIAALVPDQQSDLTNLTHWHNARIDLIVDYQKMLHWAALQNSILREPENTTKLTSLAEGLMQAEDKGLLLVPFSAANSAMAHSIRSNFWENSPIELQVTGGGLEESSEMKILEALQSGNTVPDEMYAQNFLASLMSMVIKEHVAKRGRLISYMQNYETMEETISAIATTFSIEQIENLAKNKRNILDVLRTHPLSTPLLPYVSRLLI